MLGCRGPKICSEWRFPTTFPLLVGNDAGEPFAADCVAHHLFQPVPERASGERPETRQSLVGKGWGAFIHKDESADAVHARVGVDVMQAAYAHAIGDG